MRDSAKTQWYLRAASLVAVLTAVLGCVGCRDHHADTQKRLDTTIADLREHDEDPRILEELERTTPESLQEPRAIYAEAYPTHTPIGLVVYWLEDKPTPDGIMVRNSTTGFEQQFEIDPAYQAQNEADSRDYVLFYAHQTFEPGSSEWLAFQESTSSGQPEVVLTIGGQVVSNAVPLEFVLPGER